MKKLLALIMATVLLFSLAACGDDKKQSDTDAENTTQGETTELTTEEEETTEQETTEPEEDEPEFKEVTLIDEEVGTVKVTGVEKDPYFGYSIKINIVNNSEDKTYLYSVDQCSVNGVAVDAYFAGEVDPGKKLNEEIMFDEAALEENGITEYTDIELLFTVSDAEDFFSDYILEKTVNFYPLGEDRAQSFVRENKDTDKVLIDNEHLTLIVTGMEENKMWDCYTLKFYAVNKTDSLVMLSVESASVNDCMIDPLYADSIPAGRCKFSSADWFVDDLEENEIETIEEIEMKFRLYDYNSDEEFFVQTVVYEP